MAFIVGSVYFINKLFKNDTQESLVKVVLMVFVSLVAVFIVDKVVAFKINLLTEEQSKDLFNLIKELVMIIFGYYFGQKMTNKKES